jgi:hypothetical protein
MDLDEAQGEYENELEVRNTLDSRLLDVLGCMARGKEAHVP